MVFVLSATRWPDLGPKWVRLAPNGTNPGIFQISEPKCTESDLKNSRVVPFGANLTHFWPKYFHCGLQFLSRRPDRFAVLDGNWRALDATLTRVVRGNRMAVVTSAEIAELFVVYLVILNRLTKLLSFSRKSSPEIWRSDPLENCHLNVKKLPKTWHFFKKISQKFSLKKRIATGH